MFYSNSVRRPSYDPCPPEETRGVSPACPLVIAHARYNGFKTFWFPHVPPPPSFCPHGVCMWVRVSCFCVSCGCFCVSIVPSFCPGRPHVLGRVYAWYTFFWKLSSPLASCLHRVSSFVRVFVCMCVCVFLFFSCAGLFLCSKCLGPDFVPYLPLLMPPLLAATSAIVSNQPVLLFQPLLGPPCIATKTLAGAVWSAV